MPIKEGIVSIRFTNKHEEIIKEMAEEQQIKPSKLIENITIQHIEVLHKCFKRQDLIIQRDEIKYLYNSFSKKQLDEWIELKYPKAVSSMQLFSPLMKSNEVSKVLRGWFKLNHNHLYYEDSNGWRVWKCNSDMGYNWLYVNAKVYSMMFESMQCKVKNFKVQNDGFEFHVEIPKN